jgi:hypothetical protein
MWPSLIRKSEIWNVWKFDFRAFHISDFGVRVVQLVLKTLGANKPNLSGLRILIGTGMSPHNFLLRINLSSVHSIAGNVSDS